MSAALKHLTVIRSVLRDGPLSPAELRAATGLSRHQISRARLLADEASVIDSNIPVILYSAQHHLYIETNNPIEIARALLPTLKGQITRCTRTITMIDWAAEVTGTDLLDEPDFLRSKKICEAHRQQAEDMLKSCQEAIERHG